MWNQGAGVLTQINHLTGCGSRDNIDKGRRLFAYTVIVAVVQDGLFVEWKLNDAVGQCKYDQGQRECSPLPVDKASHEVGNV